MAYFLVGIIVLMTLGQGCAIIASIRVIYSITESQTNAWERIVHMVDDSIAKRDDWWQDQLEMLLNRQQFPELAATNSATKGSANTESKPVTYVDELREIELEGEIDGAETGTS